MMKNSKLRRTPVFVLILALAALLAACGSGQARGGKPTTDWSRSLEVGEDVVGSIGIAVDGNGERVHLAWPFDQGDGVRIRYMQLNQQAASRVTSDLVFPGLSRAPRLVSTGLGPVHLFWASRVPGSPGWELWHTVLDEQGDILGESKRISSLEESVGAYEVAEDNAGGALLAWVPRDGGDLKVLQIDRGGSILSGPVLIAEGAESPALRVDSLGNVHLAWLDGLVFRYANMPLDDLHGDQGQAIADLVLGTGDSLVGPALGIADGWVSVIWSIYKQSGLEAGTAKTEYVSFPSGEPVMSRSTPILILPDEEQTYLPYQGSLALTQLVEPAQVAWQATEITLHPSAMIGGNPDLAVGLAANQQFRLDDHLQIVVPVFADGQFIGYSFASKTEGISDEPVLYVDGAGDIYAAWREGAGRSNVYYATTNAQAKETLDQLGASDFVNAVLRGSVEGLVSVAFMPFVGFGWLLPGFLVIGVWKLYKNTESVNEPSSWPVLIFALILYFAVKYSTLPTMVSYVPFSAWIHIPEGLGTVLRFGVPLLILVFAIFVANKVRTGYNESTLVFYIALAGTDAFLSLAIYGVNFLGVY